MPLDLRLLQNRVWLMEEGSFHVAAHRLSLFDKCYSAREVAKERRKRLDAAMAVTTSGGVRATPKGSKIALIEVFGPIGQRTSSALMKSAGTSCEQISAMLDYCAEDQKVSAVVLRIDSGGGSSSGIQELSDKIYNMRSEKKIYAISDSFCASAAYWIGSAAEQLFCTYSGEVGSVGAYVAHVSEQAALEMEGVEVTLVRAGKYKAELAPFLKLSDDAKGYLQEQVDDVYGKFIRAVARNRDTTVADVRDNYGQGRMLSPEAALKAGMIDKIMSMDELLTRLTGGEMEEPKVQRKRAETATAEVLRERQKLLQRASKPENN